MLLHVRRYAAFVLVSLFTTLTLGAQCPVPDGMDGGPCCTEPLPDIRVFRRFQQTALDICWRDCGIEAIQTCTATFATNLANPAGIAVSPCRNIQGFVVLSSGGGIKWVGRLNLYYSRTWLETDVAGNQVQVWRFLANGDLRATAAAGPIPCPVPPCAPAHGNRVRFTGYIDMAETCGLSPPKTEYAWMLTHACDPIDHAPGFPRAGVFHPERSYTFVGPAAGFVPGALQPTEAGGAPATASRRLNLPIPGTVLTTCAYEEPVNHNLSALAQLCLCGLPTGPQQWFLGDLVVGGTCGTFMTTPGGPFLPSFLSMGIGRWTNPAAYPGIERLRWNAGNYDDPDPCIGITFNRVYFGVSTFGGYPAFDILASGLTPPLAPTFIDQCSSIGTGATTLMNVPYLSDHILNLNH